MSSTVTNALKAVNDSVRSIADPQQIHADLVKGYEARIAPIVKTATPVAQAAYAVTKDKVLEAGTKILMDLEKVTAENTPKVLDSINKTIQDASAGFGIASEVLKHLPIGEQVGKLLNSFPEKVYEQYEKLSIPSFADAKLALDDKLAHHTEVKIALHKAVNAVVEAANHPGETAHAVQQVFVDKLAQYEKAELDLGKAANAFMDAAEHPIQTIGKVTQDVKQALAPAQQAFVAELAKHQGLGLKVRKAGNDALHAIENSGQNLGALTQGAMEKLTSVRELLVYEMDSHKDLPLKMSKAAQNVVNALPDSVKAMGDMAKGVSANIAATQQAIANELAKHESLQVMVGNGANAVVGTAAAATQVGVKFAKSVANSMGSTISGWASSALEFATHTKEKAISERIAEINGGHNGKTEYDVTQNPEDLKIAKEMMGLHTENTERKGQTLGEVFREQQKMVPADPSKGVDVVIANAKLPANDPNKQNIIVMDKGMLDALKASSDPDAQAIYKDSTTKIKMLLREEARIRTDVNTKEIVAGAQVVEVAMAAPVIVGSTVMLAPAALAVGAAAGATVGGGTVGAVVGTVATSAVTSGSLMAVHGAINAGEKAYTKVTGEEFTGGHVSLTEATTNKFIDDPNMENLAALAKKLGIDTAITAVTFGLGKGATALRGTGSAVASSAEVAAVEEAQKAVVQAEAIVAAVAGEAEKSVARKAVEVARTRLQETVKTTANKLAIKTGLASTAEIQEDTKATFLTKLPKKEGGKVLSEAHAPDAPEARPTLSIVAQLKAAAVAFLATATTLGPIAAAKSAAVPTPAPAKAAEAKPIDEIAKLQQEEAKVLKEYIAAKRTVDDLTAKKEQDKQTQADLAAAKLELATKKDETNKRLPEFKEKIGKLAAAAIAEAKEIPEKDRTQEQVNDLKNLERAQKFNNDLPVTTDAWDEKITKNPKPASIKTGIPELDAFIEFIVAIMGGGGLGGVASHHGPDAPAKATESKTPSLSPKPDHSTPAVATQPSAPAAQDPKVAEQKAMDEFKRSVEAIADAKLEPNKEEFVKNAMDMASKDLKDMSPEQIRQSAQQNLGEAKTIATLVKAKIGDEVRNDMAAIARDTAKLAKDTLSGDGTAIRGDIAKLNEDKTKLKGDMATAMAAVKGLGLDSLRLTVKVDKIAEKTLGQLSPSQAGGDKLAGPDKGGNPSLA